ncbi:MurR/RpiR family transcriptional regulator [Clostridium prolinivorans]|uniref:MurR/RpiR family transcriptional regulator n=1 Tax=Clostridium prolinivorans TaxID=2769420 RepID=UPI000FD7B9CE|nr:MurR/RpiR family transcriptional regulator [Clostridium prolinivorans]
MKPDLDKIINNKDITKLEYQVLEYIVNNINNVIKLGVRGVAKENFTSTSTVMRLAKKLGYDGFIDMVYNFMPMISNEIKSVRKEVDVIKGIDLDNFLQYISDEDVDDFVDILMNVKNKVIFVYGTGFSRLPAEYLSNRLLIIGKKSIFSSGGDSIGIFENHLEDMQVLVVVSKSGETKLVLDKVNSAKKRGIKVISITREIENSIARLADISFKIFDMNKLDDKNYYPNTFFPNVYMFIEYIIFKYFKKSDKCK